MAGGRRNDSELICFPCTQGFCQTEILSEDAELEPTDRAGCLDCISQPTTVDAREASQRDDGHRDKYKGVFLFCFVLFRFSYHERKILLIGKKSSGFYIVISNNKKLFKASIYGQLTVYLGYFFKCIMSTSWFYPHGIMEIHWSHYLQHMSEATEMHREVR